MSKEFAYIKSRSLIALIFLIAFAIPSTVHAQKAKPADAPAQAENVPDRPKMTTASFGDWTLRCQRLEKDNSVEFCEILQSLVQQGAQNALMVVAVGRPQPKSAYKITVLLPVDASFPGNLNLTLGEKDEVALTLDWRRCLPSGCAADQELSEASIKLLKSTKIGRVKFKVATGSEVALPISLNGFAQAFDSLSKQ